MDNILYIAEIAYETGELHFRYSRKMSSDGSKWIRDGHFVEYYKNGNETGVWRFYDENGTLAGEEN